MRQERAAQRMLCPLPGEFMSQDPFCPHQGTIPRAGHSSLIEVCFFSLPLFPRYLKRNRRHGVQLEEPSGPVVNVTRRHKCWLSTELTCLTHPTPSFVDYVVFFLKKSFFKWKKFNCFASFQFIWVILALCCVTGPFKLYPYLTPVLYCPVLFTWGRCLT